MGAPQRPGPGIGFLDLLGLVFGAVVLWSFVADQIGIHGPLDAALAKAGVGATGEARPLCGSRLPTWELRAAINRSIPALPRVNNKEGNLIPACGTLLLALREQGYVLNNDVVAAVLAEACEG